jgi:hypothetical protein
MEYVLRVGDARSRPFIHRAIRAGIERRYLSEMAETLVQ